MEDEPDPAKMQELQRKMTEQQSANEAELKRVLGDAKFREWQEYQSWPACAGRRTVRSSLANAGAARRESDEAAAETLQEQQERCCSRWRRQLRWSAASVMVAGGLRGGFISDSGGTPNMLEMQEKSLESMAQHQKRQREALARVLTPEQLKIVEDEHNTELQMQRAQIRLMRTAGSGTARSGGQRLQLHRPGRRRDSRRRPPTEGARARSRDLHCTCRRLIGSVAGRARGRACEAGARARRNPQPYCNVCHLTGGTARR